jgi:hypothetical protein
MTYFSNTTYFSKIAYFSNLYLCHWLENSPFRHAYPLGLIMTASASSFLAAGVAPHGVGVKQ